MKIESIYSEALAFVSVLASAAILTYLYPVTKIGSVASIIGLAVASASIIYQLSGSSDEEANNRSNSKAEYDEFQSTSARDHTAAWRDTSALQQYESDRNWRRDDDLSYKINRKILSSINDISSWLCKFDSITPRRLWILIASISVLSLTISVVSLSEILALNGQTSLPVLSVVQDRVNIELIEQSPGILLMASTVVGLLPLNYLLSKSQMNCPNSSCEADFSLKLLGRFYKPDWERTEKRENSNGDVEEYTIRKGDRIYRCNSCGKEYIQEDKWEA